MARLRSLGAWLLLVGAVLWGGGFLYVDTSANLRQATTDLSEAGAENVLLEAENSAMLADPKTLEIAKLTLEKSLSGVLLEREEPQADLQAAAAQVQSLGTQYADLAARHGELGAQYEDLSRAAGTLDELMPRVTALQDEIEALKARRQPLILGYGDTTQTRTLCTGSMAPTLTCLDSRIYLTAFAPEDVTVGSIISFDPNCWEDEVSGIPTAHRVMKIKVEDGVYYYWPKGDANEEDDGCWVPHTSVRGYLIEVKYGVFPLNAPLWDAVQAAEAAYKAARAAYRTALDDYHSLLLLYCGVLDSGGCVLSPQDYSQIAAASNMAQKTYALYLAAFDHSECWLDNARASEYPGHIPHEC